MELLMHKTVLHAVVYTVLHAVVYTMTALPLLSCTALAEKSGRFLEGSAAEKTAGRFRYLPPEGMARRPGEDEFILRRLRARDKTESFSLSLAAWPGLSFRFAAALSGPRSAEPENAAPGFPPGEAAETPLYPLSCSFLCTSYSGWNEFTLELSGTGRLTVTDRG
jgi:hypothetical protein